MDYGAAFWNSEAVLGSFNPLRAVTIQRSVVETTVWMPPEQAVCFQICQWIAPVVDYCMVHFIMNKSQLYATLWLTLGSRFSIILEFAVMGDTWLA